MSASDRHQQEPAPEPPRKTESSSYRHSPVPSDSGRLKLDNRFRASLNIKRLASLWHLSCGTRASSAALLMNKCYRAWSLLLSPSVTDIKMKIVLAM